MQNHIFEFSNLIWTSILEEPVTTRDSKYIPGPEGFQGVVEITGAWNGFVQFHCHESLVKLATTVMYGTPEDLLKDEEINDMMGELTNMISGNLKGILPYPSKLSLPKVSLNGSEIDMPPCRVAAEISMECKNQPFKILIHEKDEKGSESKRAYPENVY